MFDKENCELNNPKIKSAEDSDLAERCRKALEAGFGGNIPTPKCINKTVPQKTRGILGREYV